jgi:hypothetical protein
VSHDRWRDEIRLRRADGGELVELLRSELPTDGLQHAGAALLSSCPDPRFETVTAMLLDSLARRDWDGDEALAGELRDWQADRVSTLTPLTVDLDDLAEVLDQSEGAESFLDLESGAVWPADLLEIDQGPDDFDADDQQRWLFVGGLGPREGYGDMETFVATVKDQAVAGRLSRAIEGRGAFRRFRSELDDHPSELTRWHRFHDDARLGRARQWLADRGYRSVGS